MCEVIHTWSLKSLDVKWKNRMARQLTQCASNLVKIGLFRKKISKL